MTGRLERAAGAHLPCARYAGDKERAECQQQWASTSRRTVKALAPAMFSGRGAPDVAWSAGMLATAEPPIRPRLNWSAGTTRTRDTIWLWPRLQYPWYAISRSPVLVTAVWAWLT
jgi:hypothetical protein